MRKLLLTLILLCFTGLAHASLTQENIVPTMETGYANLTAYPYQVGFDTWEATTDDSDTTYIYGNCSPGPCIVRFVMSNPETNDQQGTIKKVKITVRAKYTTTSGSAYVGIYKASNQTVYGEQTFTLTSSYANYSYSWETNPANSDAAWTWTDISNLYVHLGATSSETKIAEIDVEVIRSDVAINPYIGSAGWATWYEAIEDFTDALQDDFTIVFYPAKYVETAAPTGYTADFNGYTFRVKGSEGRKGFPVSSDAATGTVIDLNYASGTSPFFQVGAAGSGTVIFEGLSIDASDAQVGHSIFKHTTGAANRLIVINCVLRGADRSTYNAIELNSSTAGSYLTAINNYIYDFNDAIFITSQSPTTDKSYLLHNTVLSNVDDGIDINSLSNVFLLNNLSYGNTSNDYEDIGSATGNGNLCEDKTCNACEFTNEGTATESGGDYPGSDSTPLELTQGSQCSSGSHASCVLWWQFGEAGMENYKLTDGGSSTYVKDCLELNDKTEVSNTHIQKVAALIRYKTDGSATYQLCLSDGTNESCATEQTKTETALTWGSESQWSTTPSGGIWDWSEIAALKGCIKLKNGMTVHVLLYYVYYVDNNGNQMKKTISWADSNSSTSKEYFLPSGETDAVDKGVSAINTLGALTPKARYQFESNDLTSDSSGNAKSLVAGGAPAERYDAAEGHAAVYFDNTDDYYYITDANLVAGFPARATDATPTKDLTACFWVKPETSSQADTLISKWDDATYSTTYKKQSWKIALNASNQIVFTKAYYSGGAMGSESFTHTWGLADWNWYYVIVTYDDTNKDVRIRIYNLNGDYFYPDFYDTTHTSYSMHVPSSANAPNFALGAEYASGAATAYALAWLDDVVIYNKELTATQADMTRYVSGDAFNRARGSISGIDDSGVGSAPDIGAYEYIATRNYYIGTSGNDYSDGKSDNNKWRTFWNLNNRTLSASDNVFLKKGNTWSGETAALLYLRAVGSKASASTNVDFTWLASDAGTTKPQINGYSTYSNAQVYAYETDFANVQFNNSQINGMWIYGSEDITLYGVDFYVNALASTQSVGEGWDGYVGCGCNIVSGRRMTISASIFSWNRGSGLCTTGVGGSASENTITYSEFDHNGINSPYQYAFGFIMSGYGEGTVFNTEAAWTVTYSSFNNNGYIGLGASGTGSRISDSTFHYNGGGFGLQGTYVFDGSMDAGSNFSDGQYVKGRTSGVVGRVHQCKDADYDSNRLAILDPQLMCTANATPFSCCTNYEAGCSTAFTATEYIDACNPNTAACSAVNQSQSWKATAMYDWTIRGGWSGGGIDTRYATDVEVKECEAGYNEKVIHKADAYGFDADDESNDVIFRHCVAYKNHGSGFEFHNSGKTTACAAYNCLAYDNTDGEDLANSAGFYLSCVGTGAHGTHKAILKNNVSVLDNIYALKMATSCDEANMTLENNCYWMGANTNTIDWEGTIYKAEDVQNDTFYNAESKEHYGIGADPLIVALEEPIADRFKYYAGSPLVDAGVDVSGSTALNCTAGVGGTCKDYFGNDIPFDGDNQNGAQWDVGVWERQNTGGIIPKILNFFRRRIGKIELPERKAYAAEGEIQ